MPETKYTVTQLLLRDDPVWRAAEAGWRGMREISPRLDGVDNFTQLSDSIQTRYAAFAKAVLDQQEN
ncbi:hypothetical protein [Mycobacteroides abscessus]|uniref:hypothetical protein n=1 Tax=Mycobacteroides abscessus TaxID=36809 RepID=UPI0009A7C7EC|nr:hypothetical protein [Mycobacteroides abscessus]SLD35104.1 Uncharacterised protein [Mycobacteroides abscessus subsp. bolletii]